MEINLDEMSAEVRESIGIVLEKYMEEKYKDNMSQVENVSAATTAGLINVLYDLLAVQERVTYQICGVNEEETPISEDVRVHALLVAKQLLEMRMESKK